MSHILVGGPQIPKRIQLVDKIPVRIEEHQIQRKLPVLSASAGEFISPGCEFPRVVHENPGRNKRVIDLLNDDGLGEQTCSQVGSAGSTTLIIEIPPHDDGENRTILFPSLLNGPFRFHPVNIQKPVE